MKKRKAFIILTLVVMLFSLLVPLKTNLLHVSAKEQARKIMFFGNEESNVINYVLNTSVEQDDFLLKEKKYFNENKLKADSYQLENMSIPGSSDYTDIAYPIEYVKENSEVREYLSKSLKNGKMVYLYGGLTYSDFRQTLGLDELKLKTKGDLEFDLSNINNTYDIIGFSKVLNQNYAVTIHSDPKSEYHYFREILNNLSIELEKIEKESNTKSSIITTNKVSAGEYGVDSITTTSSVYVCDETVYCSESGVAGRMYTDWDLFKGTGETESTWDYFSLETRTITNAYNGYSNNYATVKHSLQDSIDELKYGSPDDTSGPSIGITLAFPFYIGFGYDVSSSTSIELTTETFYEPEYNLWKYSGQKNGDLMIFRTAWKSNTQNGRRQARINGSLYARFALWDLNPYFESVSDYLDINYYY
ncbi:hypothetical protein RZN22_08245 [Bacillaceae bacterium S4-13-58]